MSQIVAGLIESVHADCLEDRSGDILHGIPALEGHASKVAGETMILADILSMVIREAPPVLALTLVLVLLTSWLLLGRLRDTLLCLAPAFLSLAVTIGLMSLVELDLNYLNRLITYSKSLKHLSGLCGRKLGDHSL